MSMPRWNSGLAQAIALRVIHDGDELDSMAEAVEELIDSCQGINSLLETIAGIYPEAFIETAPVWQEFRAAVARAKYWGRP